MCVYSCTTSTDAYSTTFYFSYIRRHGLLLSYNNNKNNTLSGTNIILLYFFNIDNKLVHSVA
jgi:hypothetical protein